MSVQSAYRPATRRDVEVITPQAMTNWFSPLEMLRTGVKVLLGTLFGAYLDRREVEAAMQAGVTPQPYHDYSARQDGMWIDYVADTGDGWNSTYTVASLLGGATLRFGDFETRRGEILVMGGDQVYPVATVEGYDAKLRDPYRCALPWVANESDRPHVFAIPGNHDWYDGLSSFLKVFCQQRPLGAWLTRQTRSYFALKLPYDWWLWAVDIQLETDIDKPQLDYFKVATQDIKPGHRVILCTPTSSWIDAGDTAAGARQESQAHQNLNVLEDLIRRRGAQIPLTLGGDLHHYSHYKLRGGDRHKFTAGGGGAFLLGTHQLPRVLQLYEGKAAKEEYEQVKEAYPTASRSRGLRWGALGFCYKNISGALLLGAVYLLYGWILQSASRIPNLHLARLLGRCENPDLHCAYPTMMEVMANMSLQTFASICAVLRGVYRVAAHSPGLVVFTLAVVLGLWAFCDNRPGIRGQLTRVAWGGAHGALHVLLAIGLIWASSRFNLGPVQDWFGYARADWIDDWRQVLLFCVEMLAGGTVLGGTLFGAYLVLANACAGLHWQEVFSSQSISDYKNFLRLHLTASGVMVCPVGVDKVPRSWRLCNAAKPEDPPQGTPAGSWTFSINPQTPGPWLEPEGASLQPRLIGDPVTVGSSAKEAAP